MAKKSGASPRLKLVSPSAARGDAATTKRKLGKYGQALWDGIKPRYRIAKKADLETLRLVCEARDQLCAIEQQVERDGLMVMGRNGPVAHPLLRVSSSLRSYISRYLQRLADPNEARHGPGRPGSGGVGITWRQLQGNDDDDDEADANDADNDAR